MSADADEMQTLRLSRRAALTLRGAFNIVEQLLEDFDLAEQYPITHGQTELFARMNRRLNRKLEQRGAGGFESATIREPLLPAEAQAVRDASGVLLDLLQSEQGREFLTGIGWLAAPDQPVDETEIGHLEQAQDSLDPTGVRPENAEDNASERLDELITAYGVEAVWTGFRDERDLPPREIDRVNSIVELLGERRFRRRLEQVGANLPTDPVVSHHDVFPGIIDPALDVEGNIVQVAESIANAEVGWPGTDDAFRALESAVDRDADCATAFNALVGITALAVEGHSRMNRDQRLAGELPAAADAAYTDAMSIVESEHCVGQNAQDTLWQRLDVVTERLTPGTSRSNVIQAAQQLLNDLRAVHEPPEDFSAEETNRNRQLTHITQLRATLEDRLEDPIATEDELQEELRQTRPSSGADCSEYLVSLAELAVTAARLQVFLGPDVPRHHRNTRTGRVSHERRQLLERMGHGREVVDQPLPTPERDCFQDDTLTALRNDFISILDPLEDDPDDVETRAYAVLSDIRNAFMDPRRES